MNTRAISRLLSLILFLVATGFGVCAPSGARADEESPGKSAGDALPDRLLRATLHDVTYNGRKFVAVGRHGAIRISADGRNWTLADSGTAIDLHAVSSSVDLTVTVGDKGAVVLSPDGENCWELVESGVAGELRDVAFGDDRFVAVGVYGTLLRSSDDRRWLASKNVPETHFRSVAFGGGQWLVTGSNRTALLSGDGHSWKPILAESACFGACAFVGDSFAVAACPRKVLRVGHDDRLSVDETASDVRLKDFAAARDVVVAVGNRGRILLSRDGGPWHACPSPTKRDLYAVSHGADCFVAVGARGIILTSGNGSDWIRIPTDRR